MTFSYLPQSCGALAGFFGKAGFDKKVRGRQNSSRKGVTSLPGGSEIPQGGGVIALWGVPRRFKKQVAQTAGHPGRVPSKRLQNRRPKSTFLRYCLYCHLFQHYSRDDSLTDSFVCKGFREFLFGCLSSYIFFKPAALANSAPPHTGAYF